MTVKCGIVVNHQLPGNRFKPQPCFRKFCADFGNLWLANLWPMLWLYLLGFVADSKRSARKRDRPGSVSGSGYESWHGKETLCTWNSTHQDQALWQNLNGLSEYARKVLLAVTSYWHCLLEKILCIDEHISGNRKWHC